MELKVSSNFSYLKSVSKNRFMVGRWSSLLDSASSPNAWWQQAVESSLLAWKSCDSRDSWVKGNSWNCKVIFFGSYEDEIIAWICQEIFDFQWPEAVELGALILCHVLCFCVACQDRNQLADRRALQAWNLSSGSSRNENCCTACGEDAQKLSCILVLWAFVSTLICLFDSFAQSTAEIRELQCFYLGGILVATTGDTELEAMFPRFVWSRSDV